MVMASTGRKRGFNAAKKGSGQVGFQTAPPVHPEVPSAAEDVGEVVEFSDEGSVEEHVDFLSDMYGGFKEKNIDKHVGLTEAEEQEVRSAEWELKNADVDPYGGRDMLSLVRGLGRVWGQSQENVELSLERAREDSSVVTVGDYYDYLEPDDAFLEVRSIIEEGPFYGEVGGDGEKLLEDVRSGQILVTSDDVARLRSFRDHSFAVHEETNSLERTQSLDADWISAAVQRKCELCGQFISTRSSHGSFSQLDTSPYYSRTVGTHQGGSEEYSLCKANTAVSVFYTDVMNSSKSFDARETVYNGLAYGDFRVEKRVKGIHLVDQDEVVGGVPLWDPSARLLDVDREVLSDYGDAFVEDAYMNGGSDIREVVVSLYTRKEGFLGKRKQVVRLPKNVREAVVESPPFISGSQWKATPPMNYPVLALAARVEPPFSEIEVKRMIQQGDAGVLSALLSVKRTRGTALEVISRYPSRSVEVLSQTGEEKGLSSKVIDDMAGSGDAKIRSYAASSPNLSAETAKRLAEDPDASVRRALIVPTLHQDGKSSIGKPNAWREEVYSGRSAVKTHLREIGATLINDPDPEVARETFASLQLKTFGEHWSEARYSSEPIGFTTPPIVRAISNDQKYLISKIRSRERFNDLKKFVLSNPGKYDSRIDDVAKFLAY